MELIEQVEDSVQSVASHRANDSTLQQPSLAISLESRARYWVAAADWCNVVTLKIDDL